MGVCMVLSVVVVVSVGGECWCQHSIVPRGTQTEGPQTEQRRLRLAPGCTLLLKRPPFPREGVTKEPHGQAGSLLNLASGHTYTHTPTPAKFSLHVWKVKSGVSVSLLI